MKKRQVGNSDLYVSELGLGCMSLGTDQKKAQELIETALDEGINYFDTADLYDFGENEQIVGQALKHVRDKVIIATKAGNRWSRKAEATSEQSKCDCSSQDCSKELSLVLPPTSTNQSSRKGVLFLFRED